MRKKQVTLWLTCLTGLALLVLTTLFLRCFADNHIDRHEILVRSYFWGRSKFDAEAWRRFSPENPLVSVEDHDVRGRMLFRLVRTHGLIGMSREKVVELLGNPDSPGNGYDIGSHTGFIDSDVFYITFDESGRVSDFRVDQQ